jgi:hypothetical protein
MSAAALLLLSLPFEAQAHAFPERYELPLPLGFYVAGAGGAVVLSFFLTGTTPPGPRPPREVSFCLPAITSTLVRAVRALSVLLLALLERHPT